MEFLIWNDNNLPTGPNVYSLSFHSSKQKLISVNSTMHRGSFPFLLAVAACFCLQQPFAEAGIIQGFKKEVPSTEDLSSAFDHATRRLREEYASLAAEEEAGRTTHGTAEEVVEVTDATTARGPRDLEVDAATRKGGTEVSFMIVSL